MKETTGKTPRGEQSSGGDAPLLTHVPIISHQITTDEGKI